MKTIAVHTALAFAAILSLSACGKSDAGGATTTSYGDQAKAAVDAAAKKIEGIDLSKFSGEELLAKAKGIASDVGDQLASIKDSESAKQVVAKLQPAVDQLVAVKNSLASQNFDFGALKTKVDELVTRFQNDPTVMGIIQPLIDKLKALFA